MGRAITTKSARSENPPGSIPSPGGGTEPRSHGRSPALVDGAACTPARSLSAAHRERVELSRAGGRPGCACHGKSLSGGSQHHGQRRRELRPGRLRHLLRLRVGDGRWTLSDNLGHPAGPTAAVLAGRGLVSAEVISTAYLWLLEHATRGAMYVHRSAAS